MENALKWVQWKKIYYQNKLYNPKADRWYFDQFISYIENMFQRYTYKSNKNNIFAANRGKKKNI